MSSDDTAAQPAVASGAAVADTAAPETVAPVTDAKSSKSDEPNAAVADNDKADASKLDTEGGKLLPYNSSNSFFLPRPYEAYAPAPIALARAALPFGVCMIGINSCRLRSHILRFQPTSSSIISLHPHCPL